MTVKTQDLYNAARQLAEARFPNQSAYVAAALTDNGNVLTSVWIDASCDAACLCAETGTITEAHKLNEKIIEILCIGREQANQDFKIIPACGVCHERLAVFSMDVRIALPYYQDGIIQTKTLRELRPDYWL